MLTIIGPMRSGTSLAAKLAAEAGVHMGTSMAMPWGDRKAEYEDLEFAKFLWDHADCLGDALVSRFRWYIVERRNTLSVLQRSSEPLRGWGFKSPLLAIYWPLWVKALEAEGEPLTVIRTTRHPDDIRKSIERAAMNEEHLDQLKRQQERVLGALCRIEADYVVRLNTMLDYPDVIGGFLTGREI